MPNDINKLPPTPELDKRAEVLDESQSIGQFIDWLRQDRGLTFCSSHKHTESCHTLGMTPEEFRSDIDAGVESGRYSRSIHDRLKDYISDEEYECGKFYDPMCGLREGAMIPININPEQLLADYFDIDLNKIEKERQLILDHLRK